MKIKEKKKKPKVIIIKHQDEHGKFDGQEVHLVETNDIGKLECQLLLLGNAGLAYSPWWNDVAKKIKKIKENKKNERKTKLRS